MYKVGDAVRIINNTNSHGFDIGTIVLVTCLNFKHAFEAFGFDEFKEMSTWIVKENDVEKVS